LNFEEFPFDITLLTINYTVYFFNAKVRRRKVFSRNFPLRLRTFAPAALIFEIMRRFIYQLHLWLGLVVSIPVLAWALSGFLYALPNTVEGGKIETIDQNRVKIAPTEAIQKAHEFAGRTLPTTALTLLTRDGKPFYQAIGGMGADSILINAETGEVLQTPLPNFYTRFFRQAHFYYFAGGWQTWMLLLFSALACLSALTGIYLNCVHWFGRRSKIQMIAN
jgi:uncharacterized iron-regulated membrane protein